MYRWCCATIEACRIVVLNCWIVRIVVIVLMRGCCSCWITIRCVTKCCCIVYMRWCCSIVIITERACIVRRSGSIVLIAVICPFRKFFAVVSTHPWWHLATILWRQNTRSHCRSVRSRARIVVLSARFAHKWRLCCWKWWLSACWSSRRHRRRLPLKRTNVDGIIFRVVSIVRLKRWRLIELCDRRSSNIARRSCVNWRWGVIEWCLPLETRIGLHLRLLINLWRCRFLRCSTLWWSSINRHIFVLNALIELDWAHRFR